MTGLTSPPRSYHEMNANEAAMLLARLRQAGPGTPVLLRGATVVTVDPAVPDLPAGDVLIRDGVIEAVGVDLTADGAIPVDLAGMILMPGFVDGHRHCWQNQLRHLICDAGIDEYIAMTHGTTALHYRPEDMYAGDLVTLYGALDAGFTTVLDFSHNSRSRAHSDAVFAAYREVGIRAVHTAAPPNAAASWVMVVCR